jgi:hypothetical protein
VAQCAAQANPRTREAKWHSFLPVNRIVVHAPAKWNGLIALRIRSGLMVRLTRCFWTRLGACFAKTFPTSSRSASRSITTAHSTFVKLQARDASILIKFRLPSQSCLNTNTHERSICYKLAASAPTVCELISFSMSPEADSRKKRSISETTDPAPDSDHRKRRRNRTTQSCLNCHTSKRMVSSWPITEACSLLRFNACGKCDRKRPCGRCTHLGLVGQLLAILHSLMPHARHFPPRLAFVSTRSATRTKSTLVLLLPSTGTDRGFSADGNDESSRLRKRIAELEGVVREVISISHPLYARHLNGFRSRSSRTNHTHDGLKLETARTSGVPGIESSMESIGWTTNLPRCLRAFPALPRRTRGTPTVYRPLLFIPPRQPP